MAFRNGMSLWRLGEVTSYLAGAILTAFFLAQLAQGEIERQAGIANFQAAQDGESSAAPDEGLVALDLSGTANPDTRLWNGQRIKDYEASLNASLPDVLGVLEIPSVSLKVPVYATNTEMVMDRGTGIIDGMAYPHEPGNIGISGHRDGYFRVLKDVKEGDQIVLQSLEGEKQFRIDDIQIVEISDKRLLRDTDDQSLTLVTCYPFYFVGHAPQRYIVTASLDTTYVNRK